MFERFKNPTRIERNQNRVMGLLIVGIIAFSATQSCSDQTRNLPICSSSTYMVGGIGIGQTPGKGYEFCTSRNPR